TLKKEGYTVELQSDKVKVINGSRKRQSCVGLAQKTRTYQRGGTTGDGKVGVVWQKESRHTTQGVIDYVHLDLWGPSQVESLGENQTGRTVKKLRTNNGLKFCNQEFEQLCVESGIAKHLTIVRTLPSYSR
nr:retrovirus-related Pol polyprotein from transposon TNT 1-94 [Tanacetum cinerariifolium]